MQEKCLENEQTSGRSLRLGRVFHNVFGILFASLILIRKLRMNSTPELGQPGEKGTTILPPEYNIHCIHLHYLGLSSFCRLWGYYLKEYLRGGTVAEKVGEPLP